VLIGEAATTGIIRYGRYYVMENHVFLGDPAMVIDMGPPLVSVAVNDSTIDETYVYQGEEFRTLGVVADIRDEEAIMEIDLSLAWADVEAPVPDTAYSEIALIDTLNTRSRAYEVTYDHVPLLGTYEIRLACEDYAGKAAEFDIHVATGSAGFYADEDELDEGQILVVGQTLRAVLERPFPFEETDIEAVIDTTPASEYGAEITMKDAEGKMWEVALRPALSRGEHVFTAAVSGFEARRRFLYVPVAVGFNANGKKLEDDASLPALIEFEVTVRAEDIAGDDITVTLDEEELSVAFDPDSSETLWTSRFEVELAGGTHVLGVSVKEEEETRTFSVSSKLSLTDVSAYPNPFSNEVYIFYTLSQEARGGELAIYTVAGREIFEATVGTAPGYNQYMWDGRDSAGRRVANGTYIYKLRIDSIDGEKEFIGRLVKFE
jgi:hypothetical protein